MQNVPHSGDEANQADAPQRSVESPPPPPSTPADDESHHPAGDPNAPGTAGDYSR